MQTAVDDSRFNIIAKSYEHAIASYPDARKDGDWLMDTLDVGNEEIILEISAGTGFLTQKNRTAEPPRRALCAGYCAPDT
jgi:hypothetical protein